ncbi:MAG: hypothetical protein KGJ57_05715 [Sphingomonadales bacterium]|nr:hypothetical protein [Sphingomonadales bacterium]MDE2168915.1 hypothetical protein [Sphingomonadales bacterium]
MMDLISLAPHPGLVDTIGRLDAAAIEPLLNLGASDTLALRLIGPDNGFVISRGASGDYLASVVLADGDEETTASGLTLLRAAACALAQALLRQGPARSGDQGMAPHPRHPGSEATLH